MFEILRRWWRAGGQPRERSVLCANAQGLHRLAYTEWGAAENPEVVVCVHGLTRNGRDFDELARHLSRRYRVVCPDVVGRGRSGWLPDPAAYGFPQYVADMVTLIARLDVPQVQWVGTSMGGLIGMFLASMENTPIRRLVLNDVGPLITASSLARIGEYVGRAPDFPSLAEAEAYLREICAPFGPLSDGQWQHLAEHSVLRVDDRWVMRYDPAIGTPFRQAMIYQDVNLWPIYEKIRCPVLITRGAESDLLTRDTAQEMGRRGPQAQLVEFPGVGHAPMFTDRSQIEAVAGFLHA